MSWLYVLPWKFILFDLIGDIRDVGIKIWHSVNNWLGIIKFKTFKTWNFFLPN